MRRTRLLWLSLALGALALAAGATFGAEWVFSPGILLTAPIGWLGIHVDPLSLAAFLATLVLVWVGSWLAWSAAAFLVLCGWRHLSA